MSRKNSFDNGLRDAFGCEDGAQFAVECGRLM
jgi:hypothetical protein